MSGLIINQTYSKNYIYTIILFFFLIVSGTQVRGDDYLSGSEIALIGSGSLGVLLLSSHVLDFDSSRTPLIKGTLLFELELQQLLGGEYRANKSNILDSRTGSAATPLGMSLLMLAADLSWPQINKSKTTLQDQYLFSTGLMATKGVTFIFKELIARERPLPWLDADEAAKRNEIDSKYDRQSFFSGHTSSSFFAATFVNKRLRSIMKSRLTPGEYKDWKWAPPALLFGWSTYVGWSRIHAYKHFVTDVIAGAIAGYLMAELFYSFGDDLYNKIDQQNGINKSINENSNKMLFQINVKF